ncbi:unnamed protein product [Debaryomyces fabryi]|nr:unnamed protein product [Debaryomyces fabryi]
MPCMYFSGTDSDIITFDDPENQCIRVNLDLFIRVLKNNEQNTRVFLDTHLLKIRGNENGQEPPTEKLVPKSNASVDLGNMPSMPILVYTSRTLISAEFREIDSDEFKKTYLAPLDRDVRESNIRSRPLAQEYRYPFGDASRVEHDIQVSFNEEIAGTIKRLYRDVGDRQNYFGSESIIRPPLNQRKIVQPDIIHMITNSDLGIQYPEIVFGIGDYKTGIYKMTQGFEEFKIALLNRRRLNLHSIGNFFPDREWSPRVLFALVLNKYIYQAFLCGTDRILISTTSQFQDSLNMR